MKIEDNFVIDTNILIYSIDKYSSYFDISNKLINSNKSIFTTSKSISEFIAVLSKKNLYSIIEIELPKVISNFTVIYPDKNSSEIFLELINKYKPIGNRVFDFEIISIMLSNKITKIATLNIKDFSNISEIELIPLNN